ncbi:DUF1715-domain-containing protein [Auriculariales sp. MPI-PUGE-AT-0066]|nr:DUF1715-domain-containing protein [Auriculariales sp. MPI-PUGE-AT-0066]
MSTDPFSDIVNVERNFFDAGYAHGVEQGRLVGFEEGRQLGIAKGFEMWEEIAFYEGFASTWKSFLEASAESRGLQQANALLELITKFPTSNPKHEDFDVVKLINQIRSRYKVLCATVGARPRMFVASTDG